MCGSLVPINSRADREPISVGDVMTSSVTVVLPKRIYEVDGLNRCVIIEVFAQYVSYAEYPAVDQAGKSRRENDKSSVWRLRVAQSYDGTDDESN
jgi:hypothetical protein